MERGGQVKIIELQPKVNMTKAKILYKPDFLIEVDGHQYYVDVKGHATPTFNLKARLWKQYGPGPLWVVATDFNSKKEIIPVKGEENESD